VLPLLLVFGIVIAIVATALARLSSEDLRQDAPPRSDGARIPLRVGIATAFILLVSSAASWVGPQFAGLLSPFPVIGAVLAIFAQRNGGWRAAVAVWRGLVAGMFAFSMFFLVLAELLQPAGIAVAFVSATAACLAVQGATLPFVRDRTAVASPP